MTERIRTTQATLGPLAGRWKFYIDGEYRGSAGTKTEAKRTAKALLEKIEQHEDKREPPK